MRTTSIDAFITNKDWINSEAFDANIISIFQAAGTIGLTTNEMIVLFHSEFASKADTSPEDKVKRSSLNNNLKGRRTELTYKGLIKEAGTRECSVTNRKVLYFVYTGAEISKLDMLQNEIVRITEEINRLEIKRSKLMDKIDVLS